MTEGQRFYSEEEAQEILRMAAHEEGADGVSRESLLQTAAELGISADAVRAAESRFNRKHSIVKEEQEFKAYRRRNFSNVLTSYLIINGILLGINLLKSPEKLWAIYVAIAWGIGVVLHARWTFFGRSEDYQAEFEKWRLRRTLAAGDIDSVIKEAIQAHGKTDKVSVVTQVREKTGVELDEARLAVENYYAQRAEETQQQQA